MTDSTANPIFKVLRPSIIQPVSLASRVELILPPDTSRKRDRLKNEDRQLLGYVMGYEARKIK